MKVYDLHCHSTASDGALSPRELVHRAKRCGVDVLALTDHDTLSGIPQAQEAANEIDLEFITGVEISSDWQGRAIHIVGLGVDTQNSALLSGLARLQAMRKTRAMQMAHKLEKAGISGAVVWAENKSENTNLTRTHFARLLVERNKASTVSDVFKHYLRAGKPGYVKSIWAPMAETVTWIIDAGGQAIIAHPSRYNLTATKMGYLLTDFIECGGTGLEIAYSSCNRDIIRNNTKIAKKFGLKASLGSDFHDPDIPWTQLGKLPRLANDLTPIWENGLIQIK